MHIPKTPRLRAGLIGLGRMGRHHARVLRQLSGVDLVATCDPAGDRYHCAESIPVAATVDDLLDHRLDYAVIAVPIAEHAAAARKLATAGVHALIEKPLAATASEAIAIAELFHGDLIAAVGYTERYNPALIALRERLKHRQLGTIYQIETRRQGPHPEHNIGTGVVADLATHDLDIASWLTDQPVRVVSAYANRPAGHDHEDLVAVLGQLADGTITTHAISWLSPTPRRSGFSPRSYSERHMEDRTNRDGDSRSQTPTRRSRGARRTGQSVGQKAREPRKSKRET